MTSPAQPSAVSGSIDRAVAELIENLANRVQAGEALDIEAVIAAHPEHADALRRLLPAVEVLADLGRSASAGGTASPQADAELAAGVLGDFRILREVGRGGMGVVYEAEQISLSRRVALKVLPFAATLDQRQLQRFKNEAQAAAGLQHQNIVPVYFVGCERGVHYYAMQFIDGQTVAAVIRELRQANGLDGAAPPTAAPPTVSAAGLATERSIRAPDYFRAVARLGEQTAEALQHAHDLGVIHRDVKPGNLMLDGRGNLWVTDFGLARMQADANLTLTGDLVGTVRYMSPEQASGRPTMIDHRTDVYSLGATLYELLTLGPAFTGTDRQELLGQIAFEEPRPPRRVNKALPAELETIVLKAMEKIPAERYATAKELADDLRRWGEDRPIQARRPSWRQIAARWARRRQGVLTAAAICTTLTGVLLIAGLLVHVREMRSVSERERQHAAEATRQRDLAREQRRVARQAVDKMYTEVAENWLANQPNMENVQREFLEEALHFYEDFSRTTESDPGARAETGKAYQRVAVISRNLGRYRQAVENCSRAIATFRGLADEFPDEPDYPLELARCHRIRATCREPLEDELEDGRQAVALLERLAARFPADPRFAEALVTSLGNLSNPVSEFDPQESEALLRRALAINERLLRDFGTRTASLRSSGAFCESLAERLVSVGQLGGAVENYRKSIGAALLT